MPLTIKGKYKGDPFTPRVLEFLFKLSANSKDFHLFPGTGATEYLTLQLHDENGQIGYINPSVLNRGGIVGFHFGRWQDGRGNFAPEGIDRNKLEEEFLRRYGGRFDQLIIHESDNQDTKLCIVVNHVPLAVSALIRHRAQ